MLFFYAGFLLGTFLCGVANSYHFLLVAGIVTGVFGGVIGSIVMAPARGPEGPRSRGQARLTEGDLSVESALVLSPAFEPLSACCQATRRSMVSVGTERSEPEESNP